MSLTTRFDPNRPRALRVRNLAPLSSFGSERDSFLGPRWLGFAAAASAPAFAPRLDLVEMPDEVRVTAELPGLGAEDFSIELEADVLSLRGEKRREASEDENGWHRVERSFGRFERRVRIPVEVDSERAKANYDNGLLVITLPKADAAKVREIPIQAA